ncbi:unnamed protein product [Gordionus sp. m RMFG-2023]|uniref:alpha-1,3/1,6-mannosyltransferase ALG2-like n=1 Tax=Gordionus sp. m RMFG-2023 TaxID=3053472 RepID=UPI0030E4867D
MKIIILHPDLGIGGAERLIIDIALALKTKNHQIKIYTNHYNRNHCFDETKTQLDIKVVGDWIPRKLFYHYFYACFAYLRFLFLTLYIIYNNIFSDLIICDQIPVGVPLLKLFGYKVLFYCHFPDLLLSQRDSWLKFFYRYPLDWLEEISMSYADKLIVNSNYTASIVKQTFHNNKYFQKKLDVLYPCISQKCLNYKCSDADDLYIKELFKIPKDHIFLSLNRYERKKNIDLVLRAFFHLRHIVSQSNRHSSPDSLGLVIAGGFDSNLPENLTTYSRLTNLAYEDLKLIPSEDIVFLKSISNNQKNALLSSCVALCYTPTGEHFGIVPLEASIHGKPVIAIADGGPLETIVPGKTGYLCKPPGDAKEFSRAMFKCINGCEEGDKAKSGICEDYEYDYNPNQRDEPFQRKISSLTIESVSSSAASSPIYINNHYTDSRDIFDANPDSEFEKNLMSEECFENRLLKSELTDKNDSEEDYNDWDKVSSGDVENSTRIKPEDCVKHVTNNFSFEIFANKLDEIIKDMVEPVT